MTTFLRLNGNEEEEGNDHPTRTTTNVDEVVNDDAYPDPNDTPSSPPPKTNSIQTYISLLKGSIGPGCLSLPWAYSQLGIPLGVVTTIAMGLLSSYNCLQLIKIKNDLLCLEKQQEQEQQQRHLYSASHDNNNDDCNNQRTETETECFSSTTSTDIDAIQFAPPSNIHQRSSNDEDTLQQQMNQSQHYHNNMILTYSDVGTLLYGSKFGHFVTACVCTLQLSICTVYLSFVGVNVMAVVEHSSIEHTEEGRFVDNYFTVVTLVLPATLLLVACIPSLKHLSPVNLIATILLGTSFLLLGIMIGWNFHQRPDTSSLITPTYNKIAMAICPIMYSFEGICLVLPIESSMSQPKRFPNIFVKSMTIVTSVFAIFATMCVVVFGHVDNGSITAYLIKHLSSLQGDSLILMANAFVTLSVLLTYPLQMFPSIRLLSMKVFSKDTIYLRCGLVLWTYIIAIAIPNVEQLISLAGAMAGASNALIIPPLLQWKHYRTYGYSNGKRPSDQSNHNHDDQQLLSNDQQQQLEEPLLLQQQQQPNVYNEEEANEIEHQQQPLSNKQKLQIWSWNAILIYILFCIGIVAAIVGTIASLMDIIKVYHLS